MPNQTGSLQPKPPTERTVTYHAEAQEGQEEDVTLHRHGHLLSVARGGKGVGQ